jgi:PAS domain S-box-containing protein
VDDLQVGVLIQGPGSEVRYGNRAAQELLGVTGEQLVGRTSFDAGRFAIREDGEPFPGADHPGPRAIATRRAVRDVVMGFRRPATGELIWLLVNAEPQLAGDGSVAQVITTFTDISDRKRAEQRLAESESRYRQLVEKAQDILYRTDVEGFFTYVNPVASRVMGYPEEEIVGQHFLRFIRDDHRPRVEERLIQQFRERTPSTYDEFVAVTKDGREIWIGQNVQLLTEGERVLGFQAVARDITERRRVDEALDRERRQLLDIVSHAPVAMAILDRDGRYVACSERWLRFWGTSADSVVDRSDEALFRRRSRRYAEALRRAREGEVGSDPEDAFQRDDGSSVHVRWYAHPWLGPGGAVGGVVTVVQNIDVLVRARQAALEAARARTEFLESLGEQIHRPLTELQGLVRRLVAAGLDPDGRGTAAAMDATTASLLTVVDRILDASRVESRRIELGSVDFDVRVAVREVLAATTPAAAGKRLRLEVTVDPNVPGTLRGDPWRLRQVLSGLVASSVASTAEGAVVVRVRVEETSASSVVLRFEITDTGHGIDADELARLLPPFAGPEGALPADGDPRPSLAACRRLVEAMGGTLGARSQPGGGSRVWFTARFAQPDGQGRTDRVRPTPAASGRVLVVEDNKVNQKVTVAMVQNLGYQAEAVGDGLAAVEACERARYAAVLMDCGLPGMDGFKATAWIRQREAAGRRTPIIAVTASVMPGDRESCLAAGMDDYLSKPIRLEALGSVLKKWVARPAAADPARLPETTGLPEDHPLRALEAQGMSSVVAEIIDVFLETTPLRLRELREAGQAGDTETLRAVAHSLKGAAVQIGAAAMGELCAQLLAAVRAESTSAALDLVNTLEAAFQAVALVLQAERRRLG